MRSPSRKLQPTQTISACNEQNHYVMHSFQGRGAILEIDIVAVMTGDSNGSLPGTDPPVSIPYADFTLQELVLYLLVESKITGQCCAPILFIRESMS